MLCTFLSPWCTSLFGFLVKAKLDKALEALQRCLKLLPQSSREELRRLLTFMSLAADPQGIKVDKEVRTGALFTLETDIL